MAPDHNKRDPQEIEGMAGTVICPPVPFLLAHQLANTNSESSVICCTC